MTDLLNDDEIVLRRCKKCGRYDWMEEWRFYCLPHHAEVRESRQAKARSEYKAREAAKRKKEPKDRDVPPSPEPLVYRAKWARRR